MPQKILFVCTGNICRSPLAEAMLRHKIVLAGRGDEFVVDSAGIESEHAGERPDPRSLKIAAIKGIPTDNMYARQVKRSDFEEFDLILGMDAGHVRRLQRLTPSEYQHKIHLFLEFAGLGAKDVPDPYFSKFEEFEKTYDLIESGLQKLNLNDLI